MLLPSQEPATKYSAGTSPSQLTIRLYVFGRSLVLWIDRALHCENVVDRQCDDTAASFIGLWVHGRVAIFHRVLIRISNGFQVMHRKPFTFTDRSKQVNDVLLAVATFMDSHRTRPTRPTSWPSQP